MAFPIAVSHSPATAAGCLWFGVVGGMLPDWLDLRSELKAPLRLKHRGASHSLLTMVLCTALLWVFLTVLDQAGFTVWNNVLSIPVSNRITLATAFALGVLSHLASDACTVSGIMPLLPISRWRVWLLPRIFRSRSNGYLDTLFRSLAIVTLAFGLVVFVFQWLDLG